MLFRSGLWIVIFMITFAAKQIDDHLNNFVNSSCNFANEFPIIIAIFGIQILNVICYMLFKDIDFGVKFDPMLSTFERTLGTILYFFIYLSQLASIKWFPNIFSQWEKYNNFISLLIKIILVTIVFEGGKLIDYIASDMSFIANIFIGIIIKNICCGFFGLIAIDWICDRLNLPSLAKSDMERLPLKIEEI